MANIKLFLRANSRIFINGAVFKVDRKVSIELLNDATFLLENHVLQKEDATTPFKQLYYIIQMLLIEPDNSVTQLNLFRQLIGNISSSPDNSHLKHIFNEVIYEVAAGKPFVAMKLVRSLFSQEQLQ